MEIMEYCHHSKFMEGDIEMPLSEIKFLVADRIWIAVALLHQQAPDREDFSKDEIRQKMREIGVMEGLNPATVAPHLKEHMVANEPPSTGKYQMLFKTPSGNLRLFLPGDYVDPRRHSRRSSKTKQLPDRDEIPAEYAHLLDWYSDWSKKKAANTKSINHDDDPLIRLIGSGKQIWADEHADEYVENLRREDV
jgi:hypothetical protein